VSILLLRHNRGQSQHQSSANIGFLGGSLAPQILGDKGQCRPIVVTDYKSSEPLKTLVILCYVMLCYAMLCYVMLCYVVMYGQCHEITDPRNYWSQFYFLVIDMLVRN